MGEVSDYILNILENAAADIRVKASAKNAAMESAVDAKVAEFKAQVKSTQA